MNEVKILALVSRRLAVIVPLPNRVDGVLWRGRRRPNILGKRDLLSKLPPHLKPRRWQQQATKGEIVALLSVSDCARRIQRGYRAHMARTRCNNEICTFTLNPLNECHPLFIRVKSCGYRRGFNLEMLAGYLASTGKCVDPVDNEPFTVPEITEIKRLCEQHSLKTLVIPVYRPPSEHSDRTDVLRDQLDDLLDAMLEHVLVRDRFDRHTLPHCEPLGFFLTSEVRDFRRFALVAHTLHAHDVTAFIEFMAFSITHCRGIAVNPTQAHTESLDRVERFLVRHLTVLTRTIMPPS